MLRAPLALQPTTYRFSSHVFFAKINYEPPKVGDDYDKMLLVSRTGIESSSPDDIMSLRSDLFMAPHELVIQSRFHGGGNTVPN